MKPTTAQVETLRKLARQFPEFVEYVAAWRVKEIDDLPYATNSMNVLQGRVQVLNELLSVLSLKS